MFFAEVPRLVEQTVAAMFPGDPPGFVGRTPDDDHDPEQVAGDLAKAGFEEVEIVHVVLPSRGVKARGRCSGNCTSRSQATSIAGLLVGSEITGDFGVWIVEQKENTPVVNFDIPAEFFGIISHVLLRFLRRINRRTLD